MTDAGEDHDRRAIVIVLNNSLEHHITLVYRTIFVGETVALISARHGWSARGMDPLIDELSLTDLIATCNSEPDAVLICADVHHSRSALILSDAIKCVSPDTKILIYGRATTFIPHYFARPPVDAVHASGDREVAIAQFLDFVEGRNDRPAGVTVVATGASTPGRWSSVSEWHFPALSEMPLQRYRQYVAKTYGSSYTPRISATVGKGCSWGCDYCGASLEEGHKDRRRPPGQVIDWAASVPELRDGFSLHMYHPNLFANRRWIGELCDAYNTADCTWQWRGVTTTVTLTDKELVAAAGAAGCRELAIGVETITASTGAAAKSSARALEAAATNCREAGIRLKALVMLGYPGQTEQDLAYTRQRLLELGTRIRYTGYTPLQQLSKKTVEELDGLPLERYDRRTFFAPDTLIDRRSYFETLVRNNGYDFVNEA